MGARGAVSRSPHTPERAGGGPSARIRGRRRGGCPGPRRNGWPCRQNAAVISTAASPRPIGCRCRGLGGGCPARGGCFGCRLPWSFSPSGRAGRAGTGAIKRQIPSPAVHWVAVPAPATVVVTCTDTAPRIVQQTDVRHCMTTTCGARRRVGCADGHRLLPTRTSSRRQVCRRIDADFLHWLAFGIQSRPPGCRPPFLTSPKRIDSRPPGRVSERRAPTPAAP